MGADRDIGIFYSGPNADAKVVFPVGIFRLMAEIYDETGAYTTFEIAKVFSATVPEREVYFAYDLSQWLEHYSDMGDQNRVNQMLHADSTIKDHVCWFSANCPGNEGLADELSRNLSHSQTNAINKVKDKLNFNSREDLDQGASTLYSIIVRTIK